MKQNTYSPAKTTYKVFKILELLADKQTLSPSEIARQLKFSRSTVYRFISSLYNMGYLDALDNSAYRLSYKIFMLGSTVPRQSALLDVAHPYMKGLAELSQENVNLAILYEGRVLYVDKIESSHYLKLDQPTGKTDPLHCTSLGKVLLSGLDTDDLKKVLSSIELMQYTKNTIVDPDELLSCIQKVRKQEHAIDLEELSDGINCIAVPIRDHNRKIIAAMGISAPAVRLSKNRMKELKDPLSDTANMISKKLGCPS